MNLLDPFNWFGDSGKSEPSIVTKTIPDPAKQTVANALSPYLAGQVGQGVGNMPVDPAFQSRYNEFMGLNANDLFDKNVYNPSISAYKRDVLPVVDEGYAGSLRGSGHFGAREDSMNKFQEALLGERYKANTEIPKAQLTAGQAYQNQAYDQWFKSLPQNNPAIKQGLDFLNNATNTGQTILSGLDPGQQGWMGDLLNTLIGAGSSIYGSNQIAGAIGGSTNSSGSNNSYENSSSGFGDASSLAAGFSALAPFLMAV